MIKKSTEHLDSIMDLDFKSVKALASATRLEILNQVLEEEATTTGLSKELDKSKSTVSSHLQVLTESGLLEKDDVEGRRRVVYRPTDKARAIVEGRERKVKFSVVSTAFSSLLGAFIIGNSLFPADQLSQLDDAGSDMMLEAEEAAPTAVEASQFSALDITVFVIGFGLLFMAVLMLLYSYVLRKLG